MILEKRIVIDLNDHESSWLIPFVQKAPDGYVGEYQSTILMAEGPHREYSFTDSIMCAKRPEVTADEASSFSHAHKNGFETFFVDSGWMYLYVDGRKCKVTPGDIIQLQPGQQHAMAFMEDVKYRGFFHDLNSLDFAEIAQHLKDKMPEAANDPEFQKVRMEVGGMDMIMRERPVYKEVPTEQVLAVKNPDRPYASYEFPHCTVMVITTRWENAGVNEMICARMEKGFTVQWNPYPRERELYYVRHGLAEFTVYGEKHIAKEGCIVNIPRFAPHSLKALEDSEIYDMGGKPYWFAFLQDYEAIRTYAPERLKDPEELEKLRKKFGIEVCGIGFEG